MVKIFPEGKRVFIRELSLQAEICRYLLNQSNNISYRFTILFSQSNEIFPLFVLALPLNVPTCLVHAWHVGINGMV